MARLADRWSLGFLLVAVTIALAAWWTTSDPVRVVAVLVIATPCPLILAVPVALVAGLSRAAHYGVLVKRAQPLEAMARTQTLVLDKTGTLTDGQPRITGIESAGPLTGDKVLRLAASLDQVSKHPVPEAVVDTAKSPGLALATPTEGHEAPGKGVAGTVEGRNVRIGRFEYVHTALEAPGARPEDRPAKRGGGDRPVGDRHGRRGAGISGAGRRCLAARVDRRGGGPQCAPRPAQCAAGRGAVTRLAGLQEF